MSGLYIPGMELPDGGYRTVEITFDADGYPMALADGGDAFDVIPVPPHGRLIDADALTKFIIEQEQSEHNKKKTQADKIVAEGAKGLAELFAMACPPGASCTDRDIDCNTCIMNWLLSEVDE